MLKFILKFIWFLQQPGPYEEDPYGRMRYRELPPHRMPQYEDEILAGKVVFLFILSFIQFSHSGIDLTNWFINRDEFGQRVKWLCSQLYERMSGMIHGCVQNRQFERNVRKTRVDVATAVTHHTVVQGWCKIEEQFNETSLPYQIL